jgi:acyl-CoA synthetase (AMP-forming)/AMP-acid ligase II/thioesterase domain-containing protein
MFVLLSKCGGIEDVGLGLSWDSATLVDEVSRRAAVLAQLGIGRGSVVAIAHSGTARFFADLFAAWSVGATAACLDSTLTSNELQNVLTFANSAMLLVDGGKKVDGLSVPVVELDSIRPEAGPSVTPVLNADDPALLLFTSGTTGTPKGVVLTFGALLERINANIAAIGPKALARALVSLPTFFGHGLIGNSLTPLTAGGTIVLHPLGMPLINKLGSIIDEHGISFMSSVPSLWRLALTCSPKPAGGSLVRVHVGSAPLSAALWSEIAAWSGAEVVNCYGITETANWIGGASSKDSIADGLVGTMWGGRAGVMDESGSIQDQGTGEIVIKSSCLMSGYYKRPDLTAAAFHQGYFRTGDQGLIDEHNRIWITGRIKDEINRGGFKVQPAEIDALLEGHPAVAEACVFGIPDPMGGEAVAAAIRLAKDANASPLSLQSWCSQRLRRAAVPEHWFFVSEIPRNARGKVSRDNVRRMLIPDANAPKPKAEPERPTTAVVAIAATFASDPLIPALRFALQEAGLALDVRAAPYHQLLQELRSSTSLLATNVGGIDVVVMRFEDFVRDVENLEEARVVIRQTALELQNALGDHAQRAKVPTLLAVLPPSPRAPKALLTEIHAQSDEFIAHARALNGITLISPEDVDLVSSGDRYDKISDAFTHTPFTEEHYASIAVAIARKVLALRTPAEAVAHSLVSGHNLLQALRAGEARSRTLAGNREMPATDTERRLLDLWQEILGIEGLGVEDDYFGVGGTSLTAARLFAEITRRFAVKVPLSAILEAPTVRALSRHLEQERTSPARSLIELKRGGPRKLFFVHYGVGETLLYLNLARRMPNELAVIGIEPRRKPGVALAHTRIEDMAAFYIEEVRKKQPHGPYLFAGMCAGGVIAYEMASQLLHAGETVELVALLDAVTSQTPKRVAPVTKPGSGRLKQFLEELKECELTPAERIKAVVHVVGRKIANAVSRRIIKGSDVLFLRGRLNLLRGILSRDAAWPSFVPELGFQEILNSAQACYVPKPLSIPSVVLARATTGDGLDAPYSTLYADETLGWDVVAQNLTIVDVDGGHESMLREPFVDSLARALLPYVQQRQVIANTRVLEAADA